MILILILIPTLGGLIAFWLRGDDARRVVWLGSAVVHTLLTAWTWYQPPPPVLGGWLALDALGLLFLGITSFLFLLASIYGVGYLQREHHDPPKDLDEGFLLSNTPDAVFIGCLLLFLASMTWVTASQHFGLLWVGVEATTLASAPLIYFHRHPRSLEATWKYLMICSVGIALALLGTFLFAVAAQAEGHPVSLLLGDLMSQAGRLDPLWLKAALLVLLVGYGTKMGLAPLHTWLPDAHSEAPSVVSALLSGALLNCAFLGIIRAQQVAFKAGLGAFSQELLISFGLFSMLVAAIFIIGQGDYKRMLAYSSVEHMGILALGTGLGGAAAFGAVFHAINHSLTKAALFLLAGNVLGSYRTKITGEVRGMLRKLPLTGPLWLMGLFAISGMPPFGTFLSKFTILKAALDGQHPVIATLFLVLLAMIFIGMAGAMIKMAQGEPLKPTQPVSNKESTEHDPSGWSEPLWAVLPPALLASAVLVLGVYVPPELEKLLMEAARLMNGLS